MKRSKMLEHINKCIANSSLASNCGSMNPDRTKEMIDQLSLNVLNVIEDLKMLPPRSKLKNLGIEDNAWDAE